MALRRDVRHKVRSVDITHIKELGGGGASTTYVADYHQKKIIIKQYHKRNKHKNLEKMTREWKIMLKSRPSPYVVRPIGYHTKEPPILIMEYVSNGALSDYMHRETLTFEQKLIIAND